MSDDEGFDLFSGKTLKVQSKAEIEQRTADQIQARAAARMGDVPPEQVPKVERVIYGRSMIVYDEEVVAFDPVLLELMREMWRQMLEKRLSFEMVTFPRPSETATEQAKRQQLKMSRHAYHYDDPSMDKYKFVGLDLGSEKDFSSYLKMDEPRVYEWRPEPKTLRERERAHWTSLNARGKKWMK